VPIVNRGKCPIWFRRYGLAPGVKPSQSGFWLLDRVQKGLLAETTGSEKEVYLYGTDFPILTGKPAEFLEANSALVPNADNY
jgi:hypothetical protein